MSTVAKPSSVTGDIWDPLADIIYIGQKQCLANLEGVPHKNSWPAARAKGQNWKEDLLKRSVLPSDIARKQDPICEKLESSNSLRSWDGLPMLGQTAWLMSQIMQMLFTFAIDPSGGQ